MWESLSGDLFVLLFYVTEWFTVYVHSVGTEVRRGSLELVLQIKPSCGRWELNRGSLQEYPVFSATELSLLFLLNFLTCISLTKVFLKNSYCHVFYVCDLLTQMLE